MEGFYLLLLWCLAILLVGSLLSKLDVLGYLVALVAGWISATITLPIISFYFFNIYLGGQPTNPFCWVDVQLVGRLRSRALALVTIKDETLSWKTTVGGNTTVQSSVHEAENCLEISNPDRPLLYKDNYMYLISPSAKKIQNCYAALTAVLHAVSPDPQIYSGDAGVEGFNSLLSTLQFEVKESSTWINAFAARCFMFFRQSEKFRSKLLNMFAKSLQNKFGDKGLLGGMLTDIKISGIDFGSASPKFTDIVTKVPYGDPNNPNLDINMAIELPGGAQFTGEAKVDMGLKKIQTKLTITLNHLQGQLYLHLPCFPYTSEPDINFGFACKLGEGHKSTIVPIPLQMQKALQKKVMKPINDKFVWPNRKYFTIPFAPSDVQPVVNPKAFHPFLEQHVTPNRNSVAPDSEPTLRRPQPPSPSQSPVVPHLPPLPPRKLEPRHTSPSHRRHSFHENSIPELESSEDRPRSRVSTGPHLQVTSAMERLSSSPSVPVTAMMSEPQTEHEKRSRSRGRKSRSPIPREDPQSEASLSFSELSSEELEKVMAHEFALSSVLDEIHITVDVSQEQLMAMKDIRRQICAHASYHKHKEFLDIAQQSIVSLSEAIFADISYDSLLQTYETKVRSWIGKLCGLYLSYWNILTPQQQSLLAFKCACSTWEWWTKKFTQQKSSMLWALCSDVSIFCDMLDISTAQGAKITKIAGKYGRNFTQEGLNSWWEATKKEIEVKPTNPANSRKMYQRLESSVIDKEKVVKNMMGDLWKVLTPKQKVVWYRNEAASLFSQIDDLVSPQFFYRSVVSKNVMNYY